MPKQVARLAEHSDVGNIRIQPVFPVDQVVALKFPKFGLTEFTTLPAQSRTLFGQPYPEWAVKKLDVGLLSGCHEWRFKVASGGSIGLPLMARQTTRLSVAFWFETFFLQRSTIASRFGLAVGSPTLRDGS